MRESMDNYIWETQDKRILLFLLSCIEDEKKSDDDETRHET